MTLFRFYVHTFTKGKGWNFQESFREKNDAIHHARGQVRYNQDITKAMVKNQDGVVIYDSRKE